MSKAIMKERECSGIYDEERFDLLVRTTTFRVCGIYTYSFNSLRRNKKLLCAVFLKNEDERDGHVWNATTMWLFIYDDGFVDIGTNTYLSMRPGW